MKQLLAELREELAHAFLMADVGRDPSWLPVIYDLDTRIKELEELNEYEEIVR